MTGTLAIVLPLLLIVALRARPPHPRVETIPEIEPRSASQNLQPLVALLDRVDLWSGLSVRTWVYQDENHRWLELQPTEDPRLPELLLYWSPTPPDDERLPEDSALLGELAGVQVRRFPWPSTASSHDGTWILYSLGHGRVVATARITIEEG